MAHPTDLIFLAPALPETVVERDPLFDAAPGSLIEAWRDKHADRIRVLNEQAAETQARKAKEKAERKAAAAHRAKHPKIAIRR